MDAQPRGVRSAKLSPLPAVPLLLLLLPGTGAGHGDPENRAGPRVRRGCGPERSAERQGQGRRGRGPAPCVVCLRPSGEVGGCVRVSPSTPTFLRVFWAQPGGAGRARTGGLPSPARGYRLESQTCQSSCLAHWVPDSRAQTAVSTVRIPPTSSF